MPHPALPTRYTLGPEIGRGGMGVVYEALDTRLKRRVAIKFLGEGGQPADRRRRFLQEARAASSLNHPNIVTVHDVDNANGVDFIVMEHVDGTPLHRVIEAAGLPLDRLLGYARQLGDALAAAHRAGIVHRDLKPSNVMLARDGRLKILDFGLSKLSPQAASSEDETTLSSGPKTARGVVVGSPGYMSPEQAVGADVDARTDVFSLGVVLFEMASGARPHAVNNLRALLHEKARSLLEVRKDVPPAFARLVARCLEKDPADRYPSAIEVQRDLELISGAQPAAAVEAPTARARRLRAVAAAAALLLVTAGVAGWVYARRAASERERAAAAVEAERLVDGGRLVDAPWALAALNTRDLLGVLGETSASTFAWTWFWGAMWGARSVSRSMSTPRLRARKRPARGPGERCQVRRIPERTGDLRARVRPLRVRDRHLLGGIRAGRGRSMTRLAGRIP